jgi:hypothetical protein
VGACRRTERGRYAGRTQDFTDDSLQKLWVSRNMTERELVRPPSTSRASWHQPGMWLRLDALRVVGIDQSLQYRFDLDLLIRYLRRFPRVHYISSTLAWFRLHPMSKTVSKSAQFLIEPRVMLKRMIDEPDAHHVWSDARNAIADMEWRQELRAMEQVPERRRAQRLLDIALAANRTPHAWRTNATYDSLGRLLRGEPGAHRALVKPEWRKTVRSIRDGHTLSRIARAWAIFQAARRTPAAWGINTTHSTIIRLLTGKLNE